MNYYKIVDESLRHRMENYAAEAETADKAANDLAVSVGADGYTPSPYGEFGGVLACSFPAKAPHSFRFAGESDGYRYYEPSVNVTESVEDEHFVRGIERRQTVNRWYSVREITQQAARSMMDYARAIELAHLKWSGKTMAMLAETYRVSPSWMTLYYQGQLDFANLCGKSRNYGLALRHREQFDKDLSEAMQLEHLLTAAFLKVKLYHVKVVRGPRRAVSFYRAASQLPLVPSGRLAKMLGIRYATSEVYCPSFFKSAGAWYIATSGKIESDKVVSVSELDYETAKMNRGEN